MSFWRRCKTCGGRSFRACGARNGEMIRIGGGYYKWSKFNPCTPDAPGGIAPDAGRLDPDGGLDDLSDIVVSSEGGSEINEVPWSASQLSVIESRLDTSEIAKNGGVYGSPPR